MIENIVEEVINTLNLGVADDQKELHEKIVSAMEPNAFVWRKDYTIAVSKDDKKTKVANLMVCNKLDETEQTFKVKREKDYWKKLEARDDYEAVVECSSFGADVSMYEIETIGRDIMRSRKEVPTVAVGGFVWVVAIDASMSLDLLFTLYFKENVRCVEKEGTHYYVGWTDNLKTLDMRHFICDPITKKVL